MVAVMQRPRPSPEIVEAKKREIARRYRRRRKHASKSQFAAIRVAELNRLFRARYGEQLPDDATGRDCLMIVAHHLIQLSGHPQQRLFDWVKARCPWLTMPEFNTLLAEIATTPKTWKADSLAWRLRLNYEDRQSLKIMTIGATDCSAAQRKAKRRAKQRARMKALRASRANIVCAP